MIACHCCAQATTPSELAHAWLASGRGASGNEVVVALTTFPNMNVLYNVHVALRALRTEDDGLICPDVGGWAETKYRLLALYDALFSTGMKNFTLSFEA